MKSMATILLVTLFETDAVIALSLSLRMKYSTSIHDDFLT